MNKYRLYCESDSKWESVIADSAPTVCPTNAGHTIKSNSIVIFEQGILVNDGTLKLLSLASYKQLRYNEIDYKTMALIASGFSYDSEQFSLSIPAQMNWSNLKFATAEFTWPVSITTIDNDEYSLTQANVVAFYNAGKDQVKTHVDSGRTLKKSILDAADEAAVDAITDTR